MTANGPTFAKNRPDRQEIRISGPRGRMIVLTILMEHSTDTRFIRLLGSEDNQTVYLESTLRSAEACIPTPEDINGLLKESGVQASTDDECMKFALRLLRAERRIPPIEIAFGIPPNAGRNGEIEFLVKPSSKDVEYHTDEKGNVDFRQTNRFQNVLTNNRIARLLPPTKGQPGTDIFGRPVPTRDGDPLKIRITERVILDQKENVFLAAIDGRVVYEDEQLDIDDNLIIHGDVDFSVGNIDFVGSVEIMGSVLDDFRVHAKKGIIIHGDVGACTIASDGTITIRGGVAGRGRGQIISQKGDIQCHYFNDTTVQLEGNLSVEREILNSRVQCLGRINIPRGAIVGGDIVASAGIETKVAGSELGVRTRLESGTDWKLQQQMLAVHKDMKDIVDSVEEIEESLKPLVNDKGRIMGLNPGQKQLVTTMLEQLKALRLRREECQQHLDVLELSVPTRAVKQINVLERLYAGVYIQFGDISTPIMESSRGPQSITPNKDIAEAEVGPFKKLPEKSDMQILEPEA